MTQFENIRIERIYKEIAKELNDINEDSCSLVNLYKEGKWPAHKALSCARRLRRRADILHGRIMGIADKYGCDKLAEGPLNVWCWCNTALAFFGL